MVLSYFSWGPKKFQNWQIFFNIPWFVMNTKINLNEVISYVFNKPYYLSKISLVFQQWCSNTILMVYEDF